MGKICVICGKTILFRKTKKAKTCCQSCAGKLAWKTIKKSEKHPRKTIKKKGFLNKLFN